MRFEAGLTLVGQDNVSSLPVGVMIAFAAAAANVALLGRRRLPAGLGEGAFVAALSGGVLLLLAVDATGSLAQPAAGHVLTALTVFWYALSKIVTRRRSGVQGPQSAETDEFERERTQVWAWAALVCGLAALVNCLVTATAISLAVWPAAATDFVVLLLLSLAVWLFDARAWAVYPAVTLLACLLVLVIPPNSLRAYGTTCGVGMNVAGALSLFVVIGTILLRWWRRRRLWLQDPRGAAELPIPSGALLALLVGASLLVGIGGVLLREAAFTPSAVLLAALTCLTIGPVRAWLVVSEIGLILVAESVVTASLAWVRPGWSGALLGVAVAGAYLLWLARFWDQQLNDGVAWTTAGRLIPIARRLAYAAYVGAVALASGGFSAAELQSQPVWMAALTVLLLLGGMSLLVRDGQEHRRAGAAFAACLTALAATGPGCRLLSELTGSAVSPVVLAAAGALLLALRVALTPRTSPTAAVYDAYVGGALPLVVLFVVSLRGVDTQAAAALVLCAGAVLVAFKTLRASSRATQAEHTGGA
ncbi:MAG: hypothetical protein ACE5I3_01620 [Phycisphaerae bacterium]